MTGQLPGKQGSKTPYTRIKRQNYGFKFHNNIHGDRKQAWKNCGCAKFIFSETAMSDIEMDDLDNSVNRIINCMVQIYFNLSDIGVWYGYYHSKVNKVPRNYLLCQLNLT